MSKPTWKAWHQVVTVRPDLLKGELSMAHFAADLYEVIRQRGEHPTYERPEEFFAFTYPSYNLRNLARDVAARLAGKSDKAVRQLVLTYGGGKTHTLVTMRHLFHDPAALPQEVNAVVEFRTAIGIDIPKARVVALCFDKFDADKGLTVKDPQGNERSLKHPWSWLAYQLAGDVGLAMLQADGKSEERDTAPAEPLLKELLDLPRTKEGLGTLVLIDEVLMYAREKCASDKGWRSKLVNFFQYLTQAATKADRCCIVASLLASDPGKSDTLGREIQDELYNIFQRQREEVVEPVVKGDVAEVLRRRFFTNDSIKHPESFRPHVQAALQGIVTVDEQTKKDGAEAETRFLASYPFHPDLTEVFYSKWTTIDQFQRTRGVLRTFALALRAAATWDKNPLVGPAVFLNAPGAEGLSEAARELVTIADHADAEGRQQRWTGILVSEVEMAHQLQAEVTGLKHRELEAAVVATFLHSLPVGMDARIRELKVLVGMTRPDRIELDKALLRWAKESHWLDDRLSAPATTNELPVEWRLGSRPNLRQMHAKASKGINDTHVVARLLDELGKTKSLVSGASSLGVRTYNLPGHPREIEDNDATFRYAVLGPNAASQVNKPSDFAIRFITETTAADKPRINRNAILLLVPEIAGLEAARLAVRERMAWETVHTDLLQQVKDGEIDPVRVQTLKQEMDMAAGRIPQAIKAAWSLAVTVNEKNDIIAFKISLIDDNHFNSIKADSRARLKDTAIEAEALLPGGPYNLWKTGDQSRYVSHLASSFAQTTSLPKMLQARTITDTLVQGCAKGSFVLRLRRPDGTFRTWWYATPDDNATQDPALEIVLSEHAKLAELPPDLLTPNKLPELWKSESTTVKALYDYFNGGHLTVKHDTWEEQIAIPKADRALVDVAISQAVEKGLVWFRSGQTSLLAEVIPPGVITELATLSAPPGSITAGELLPEVIAAAWKDGTTTALALANQLSAKHGQILPWKTVREAVHNALNVRFLELLPESEPFPCDFSGASKIKLRQFQATGPGNTSTGPIKPQVQETFNPKNRVASADLEPAKVQDLADIIPDLLKLKASANVPLKFRIMLEIGDGKETPSADTIAKINALLKGIQEDFELR